MIRKSFAMTSAALAAVLIAAIAATTTAYADDYPSHPIVMVVPLAPGGSTDVLARITAQGMSKQLGQPVVVENTSGAGGTIGVTKAERSRTRRLYDPVRPVGDEHGQRRDLFARLRPGEGL